MATEPTVPAPQPAAKNRFKIKFKKPLGFAGPATTKGRHPELAAYPEPKAELKILVALIDKHAETERLLPTFPAWPQLRDMSAEERAAKRSCTVPARDASRAGPGVAAPPCQDPAENLMQIDEPQKKPVQALPVPPAPSQQLEVPVCAARSAKESECQPDAQAQAADKKDMVIQCGPKDSLNGAMASSASDQATTCAFGQNASPTEVTAAAAAAAAAGLPASAPAILPTSRGRGGGGAQDSSAAVTAASASHTQASPSRRPTLKGESIGTQTANTISLLPPNLLTSSSGPAAALPHHIALNQLMLPPHMCYMSRGQDPPPSEAEFQRLVTSARDRKRHADRERGPNAWTYGTLQMYVQSALIYLKAVECLLQLPQSPDRSQRAASLCSQTADLLLFTVRCCEGLPSSAIVREALRTLCERLAAVCLLKDCMLQAHRYKEHAERLDRLVQEASTTAAEAGAYGRKRGDSLLDETHACSSDQRASTTVRPPVSQASIDLQAKVVAEARQMAKFADLVRRSVISFQSLSEREEARMNPLLGQACMHISAVCMSGGGADGERVISHAHQALKLLGKL